MFKQPLTYLTAKAPMLKGLNREALKDKSITRVLANAQAHHYLSNNEIRSVLMNILLLGKYLVSDRNAIRRMPSKFAYYPYVQYGLLNQKLNSIRDEKTKDLFELVLKDEKKITLLNELPHSLKNYHKLKAYREKLVSRTLKNYDLSKTIDELLGDIKQYDEEIVEEFLMGLKLSKKMNRDALSNYIKNNYLSPYKVIEKEKVEVNISGELETIVEKEYENARAADANNINEDIFQDNNIYEMITSFVHFAPITHLDVLTMYIQENMTKTFLDQKRLSLLVNLFNRYNAESHAVSFVEPIASSLKHGVRFKLDKSATIMSPSQKFEIELNGKSAKHYKNKLLLSILYNPDLDRQVVVDFFKENRVLTKNDIEWIEMHMGDKFPEFIEKKDDFLYPGIKFFYEDNDPAIKAHSHIIMTTKKHGMLHEDET
ncbi:uncharacterized protein HGUI_00747 [Hanseniaspora guilliermondii]|uniref:Uncharacterized protein n=1 Tax=Hanseniaspora guilliermondii TaxID=56406 RepID=A0A1L0B0Q4_9ASCO|nr:uncharacterized protein HGUI_00747 [Hanseniaspora guilliermondii]